LGVNSAHVIGASNGGYIATNYALYAPERVKKLVLLGPMGLTPSTESTVRKLDELASSSSINSSKEQMLNWVIGDNSQTKEMCEEWLSLVLDGVQMQINIPKTFLPSQLERLQMPVMLFLGKEDHLVGNPENVKTLAKNVPNIEIEVLDTGHLISVEQPDYVNSQICDFLNKP
jgi:pimeloyl-ACP methyl ester carboxylesterase